MSYEDGFVTNYSTSDDLLTFGGNVQTLQRYSFDDSATFPDVYCIALTEGIDRSAKVCLSGVDACHLTRNLPHYGFDYWDESNGKELMVQIIGGDGSGTESDVYVWVDRPAVCEGVWYNDNASYSLAGCPVNWYCRNCLEGNSYNHNIGGINYELTIIYSSTNKFLKCSAKTYAVLGDCMDDSFNDVNGIDNGEKVLWEHCNGDEGNAQDSQFKCDVRPTNNDLNFLYASHLTDVDEEMLAEGIPIDTSFRIYKYSFCGSAFVNRDLFASFSLTQITSHAGVCNLNGSFSIEGYTPDFKPVYGHTSGESIKYYTTQCPFGEICEGEDNTTSGRYYFGNVCYLETGSCYDGIKNRNETGVDYGGLCGNCSSNSTKENDLLFLIAYESFPIGYFDNTVFVSSVQCVEADESTNFLIIFVFLAIVLTSLLVLGVFVVIFIIIGLVIGAGVTGLFSFFKRRKKENYKKGNNQ